MRLLPLLFAVACVAQTVSVTPTSVVQTFQSSVTVVSAAAVSAKVSIFGSGSVTLVPTTQTGGNWLAVTPASGSLPLTATIAMDPQGLPDGTYLGSVQAGAATIPVTILVGDPGPQLPASGVVNAASQQAGAISPGEVVTLLGAEIGPKIPYGSQVWDGVMTTRVAGTRVWFGNTAAPIVYAYPNQLQAVVPFNVAGQKTVQVQVENLVARTPLFSMTVQEATPALFTADSSGTGQVVALNQDGSSNSRSHPAVGGSTVVLYATGAGTLSPAVSDGTIVASTTPLTPVLPVEVTIGGQSTTVLSVSAVPAVVAGMIQVRAIVPIRIPTGNAVVVLAVGTVSSPNGCTIAVWRRPLRIQPRPR